MEEENISVLPVSTKIDPTEFDVSVSALLIGLGAEKYVDIFRKNNIGQLTLLELTEEDMIKLGIDDANLRQKIIDEVNNLPICQGFPLKSLKSTINLGPIEIADIFEETSQHLYRIYLSVLANTLAIKKTKNISDSLLHQDKYASDIALSTISEMTNILNSMDIMLHTELKGLTKVPNRKNKKIIIGTLGSAVIAVLAVLFTRSLKHLK